MEQELKKRLATELPECVKTQKTALRSVQEPDTTLLNEQQLLLYNEMLDMVQSEGFTKYSLEGYAGTGKTYLISMFIEKLLLDGKRVCVTAPTGKAVKVLYKAAQYTHDFLDYRTMHSLLGLRENIDSFGNVNFIQLNRESAKVGEYDIIIHDETSMLNNGLIQGVNKAAGLFDYMDTLPIKVIFVGDYCQIPPVKESLCRIADEEFRQEHGIHMGRLTQIVRQAEGNPMIDLTLKIRKFQGRDNIIPIRVSKYTEDTLEGVFHLDGKDLKYLYLLLKTYFTSEQAKADSDYIKVLAWTNKVVDKLNGIIRYYIHGKDASKLCLGERLLVDMPTFSIHDDTSKAPSIGTNTELEVKSYKIVEKPYKGVQLKYYEVDVTQDGGTEIDTIRVIHEDSEQSFSAILDHYKEVGTAKKGTFEGSEAWKEFYSIKKIFAQVKYNYAITCHKAQGSTFTNCIVLEGDLDRNHKVVERNKIKYTAFTRAAKRLIIVK